MNTNGWVVGSVIDVFPTTVLVYVDRSEYGEGSFKFFDILDHEAIFSHKKKIWGSGIVKGIKHEVDFKPTNKEFTLEKHHSYVFLISRVGNGIPEIRKVGLKEDFYAVLGRPYDKKKYRANISLLQHSVIGTLDEIISKIRHAIHHDPLQYLIDESTEWDIVTESQRYTRTTTPTMPKW